MDYKKYYIYGTLSGTVATCVSHPFFTLKNSLQNNEPIKFTGKFYFDTKLLYSGFIRSCIGYSIEKSLVFGTYNTILSHFNLNRENIYHSALSGFLSGIIASLSITPFEQLTIDKQRNIKLYTPVHLYKGLFPTMARESIGFAIYFTVYDQISAYINPHREVPKTIFTGCLAIISAWSIITPIDKIKTNIQSNTKIDIHNIVTAYKGFNFALMRAIPFHVTCFLVFEYLQKNNKSIIKDIESINPN
jgi:hypothetical protein